MTRKTNLTTLILILEQPVQDVEKAQMSRRLEMLSFGGSAVLSC